LISGDLTSGWVYVSGMDKDEQPDYKFEAEARLARALVDLGPRQVVIPWVRSRHDASDSSFQAVAGGWRPNTLPIFERCVSYFTHRRKKS